MSNFSRYYRQLDRAQGLVSKRESRLHLIVYDVLAGLDFDTKRLSIESVSVSGEWVYVLYGWSSRGLADSDDIKLPLSLFTADDPKAAAQLYRKTEHEEKAKAERRSKEAQLERLQKELGQS